MAVTNTGIVLRTITGVNESDLFLDSEATSVTTNTGIVERSIVGVHDANFAHPVGDELVLNGGFSNGSTDWVLAGETEITEQGGRIYSSSGGVSSLDQSGVMVIGNQYKLTFDVIATNGTNLSNPNSTNIYDTSTIGSKVFYITAQYETLYLKRFGGVTDVTIDSVSVKEVLVNRESTTTNTGIVERSLTGVNESDLWLDSESTSVVNNTCIVERPITGVNESDPMFPDNTTSTVTNI